MVNNPPLTLHEVEGFPTADLHLHLDGAMTPGAIMSVAKRHAIEVPGIDEQSLEALRGVYPDPGPFESLGDPEEFNRFLRLFGQALSVMRTPESMQDSTLEVVRQLAEEGTFYAELRFAPSYHVEHGRSPEDMKRSMMAIIEGALRGMELGRQETGVITKLIIVIPREIAHPTPPGQPDYAGPQAEAIVQAALEFQNNGVVAIDLACSEYHDPDPYVPAFALTFGERLKRTVHAGEAGPGRGRNIVHAFQEMRADGLGHALPLPRMRRALRCVVAAGVRVERAPVSNRIMGVSDGDLNGLDRLIDSGALVSVNSDDPGVFGPTCSLPQNLLTVANRYGWGLDGLRRLTENAIRSAFVTEEERAALFETFRSRVTEFQESEEVEL